MCVPIFILSDGFGKIIRSPLVDKRRANGPAKFVAFGTLSETIVFITSLVIGILGLVGVIHMPPAAAYALISVSGAIGLSYGILVVLQKRLSDDRESGSIANLCGLISYTIKITCLNGATK